MNAKEFEDLVGRPPEQDDLERVNCSQEGDCGHHMCGVCDECGQPRFVCGGWVVHNNQRNPGFQLDQVFGGDGVPQFKFHLKGYNNGEFDQVVDFVDNFLTREEWFRMLNDLNAELNKVYRMTAMRGRQTEVAMANTILKYMHRRAELGELEKLCMEKEVWRYRPQGELPEPMLEARMPWTPSLKIR